MIDVKKLLGYNCNNDDRYNCIREMLAPYMTIYESANTDAQQYARNALRDVVDCMNGINPHNYGNSKLDYSFKLWAVQRELNKNNYVGACHELINVIYFYDICDIRIMVNVIDVIKSAL